MGGLSPELREWIVPGLAGVLAVVDGEGAPHVARVWAARPRGADIVEVYLQQASSHAVALALDAPRRGALNLIEVTSYRSRAFKGECALANEPVDTSFSEASITAMSLAFERVGLPADGAERMLSHTTDPRAMVVVHLRVESAFDQSPKPGAGARL